jgi:hypothetical protein
MRSSSLAADYLVTAAPTLAAAVPGAVSPMCRRARRNPTWVCIHRPYNARKTHRTQLRIRRACDIRTLPREFWLCGFATTTCPTHLGLPYPRVSLRQGQATRAPFGMDGPCSTGEAVCSPARWSFPCVGRCLWHTAWNNNLASRRSRCRPVRKITEQFSPIMFASNSSEIQRADQHRP